MEVMHSDQENRQGIFSFPVLMGWAVSELDWRHTGRLRRKERQLADGRVVGVGEEPNHTTDSEKAWSSMNHSIISGGWFLFNFVYIGEASSASNIHFKYPTPTMSHTEYTKSGNGRFWRTFHHDGKISSGW
jgi:hypothetical protein